MRYQFGHVSLEPHKQLIADGQRVRLGRRALDILSELAKADGAIVSKDELMSAVWPGLVVEENAIQVHIAAIRRALGTAADALVTVRGVGYQLIATAPRLSVQPLANQDDRARLAVLSFENRSPDAELRFFAESVAEEILLALSRTKDLVVFARNSTFQMDGSARIPRAVREAIGATHVLDGSVQRQSNRVRITVQLSETEGSTMLWSDRFDGGLSDIFALQEEIATSVASQLSARLHARSQTRRIDPHAMDAFLKARHLSGREDAREECIGHYRRAVEIDPSFAEAWGWLALILAVAARWDYSAVPFETAEPEARAAAARALALDASLTTPYVALSNLEPFANYAQRALHLDAARALGDSVGEVLTSATAFAYSVGRIAEAAEFAEQAWRKDPLNPVITHTFAATLAETGQSDRAHAIYDFGQARWPDISRFTWEPLLHAANVRDWERVDALLPQLTSDNGPEATTAKLVAAALRTPSAYRESALARIRDRTAAQGWANPSSLALLSALGYSDEVFELVDASDYAHLFTPKGRGRDDFGFAPGVIFNSISSTLRRDPRFLRLAHKLGMCRYWVESGRWPDCADATPYDFRANARALL